MDWMLRNNRHRFPKKKEPDDERYRQPSWNGVLGELTTRSQGKLPLRRSGRYAATAGTTHRKWKRVDLKEKVEVIGPIYGTRESLSYPR
jgi:hypothetical protein